MSRVRSAVGGGFRRAAQIFMAYLCAARQGFVRWRAAVCYPFRRRPAGAAAGAAGISVPSVRESFSALASSVGKPPSEFVAAVRSHPPQRVGAAPPRLTSP